MCFLLFFSLSNITKNLFILRKKKIHRKNVDEMDFFFHFPYNIWVFVKPLHQFQKFMMRGCWRLFFIDFYWNTYKNLLRLFFVTFSSEFFSHILSLHIHKHMYKKGDTMDIKCGKKQIFLSEIKYREKIGWCFKCLFEMEIEKMKEKMNE